MSTEVMELEARLAYERMERIRKLEESVKVGGLRWGARVHAAQFIVVLLALTAVLLLQMLHLEATQIPMLTLLLTVATLGSVSLGWKDALDTERDRALLELITELRADLARLRRERESTPA
jgi:hypothetical protein